MNISLLLSLHNITSPCLSVLVCGQIWNCSFYIRAEKIFLVAERAEVVYVHVQCMRCAVFNFRHSGVTLTLC